MTASPEPPQYKLHTPLYVALALPSVALLSIIISLGTALLVTILLSLLLCANVFAKSSPGWVLSQHGDIIGDRRLFLTTSAIRIDSLKGGYSIVSQAPNWAVTIWNRRSSKFIQMPFDSFKGETMSKLYSADKRGLSLGKWTKISSSSFCGYPTSTFTMQPTQESLLKGNRIAKAQYCLLSDFILPQKALNLLRLIYQLPLLNGIPVSLTFFDLEDNYTVRPVVSSKIEKTTVADDVFTLPAGLTRTKDQMQVFVDPLSNQAYEGFAGWIEPNLGAAKSGKSQKIR